MHGRNYTTTKYDHLCREQLPYINGTYTTEYTYNHDKQMDKCSVHTYATRSMVLQHASKTGRRPRRACEKTKIATVEPPTSSLSHKRWLVPTNTHHTCISPGRRAVSHNYIHILVFTICRRPFDLKHDWWLFKAVKRRGGWDRPFNGVYHVRDDHVFCRRGCGRRRKRTDGSGTAHRRHSNSTHHNTHWIKTLRLKKKRSTLI